MAGYDAGFWAAASTTTMMLPALAPRANAVIQVALHGYSC